MLEFIALSAIVFIAIYLLGTVHFHCPYWQLPLGFSFFVFSLVGSVAVQIGWLNVLLAWGLGVIPAVLLIIRGQSSQ